VNELIGQVFGDIVLNDRFSDCNILAIQQLQQCMAHLLPDLTAIAERSRVSAQIDEAILEL
jgi:hypothetical protein